MISSKKVLTVFFGLSYAAVLYFSGLLVIYEENANLYYSFLSVTTAFFCFLIPALFGINRVSVLNLFLIAYSVFVFGRCFYVMVIFFTGETTQELNGLYNLSWMANHVVGEKGARFVFWLTNFFVLFVMVGYVVGYKPGPPAKDAFSVDVAYRNLMLVVFILTAPVYFYELISLLLVTMREGYLAKFSGQADDGGGGSSIVKHIFYISLISLIVLNEKRAKYYLIFLLIPFLSILSGGRGGFVYPVLTFIYIYFRINSDFKLGYIKATSILVFVFIVMSGLIQLSARGQASTDDFFDALYFIYAQGVTLGVISFSTISGLEYEWHTLAQSFLPGMARIYSFLNPETPGYMGSITTFISYYANPEMFLKGNGLGSSIVSELYILSFNSMFLFLLGAALLGFLFSFIEARSYQSWKVFIFLAVVLPYIINAPRNGFNVLFVSSIYVASFLAVLLVISKFRVQVRRRV